jgi:hypothetical protein
LAASRSEESLFSELLSALGPPSSSSELTTASCNSACTNLRRLPGDDCELQQRLHFYLPLQPSFVVIRRRH